MMGRLDAANRYQSAPHVPGGNAFAHDNMGIATAHASTPVAAMILIVSAMAAIFTQLPTSAMSQNGGQKSPRAYLELRRSRAKLPRRLPIARCAFLARQT